MIMKYYDQKEMKSKKRKKTDTQSNEQTNKINQYYTLYIYWVRFVVISFFWNEAFFLSFLKFENRYAVGFMHVNVMMIVHQSSYNYINKNEIQSTTTSAATTTIAFTCLIDHPETAHRQISLISTFIIKLYIYWLARIQFVHTSSDLYYIRNDIVATERKNKI